MPTTWPSGPLDAAQRAFDLLTCPPAPLAFDGCGFAGLPDRLLPLDELKRLLVATATPRPARDTVWRELVTRARRDGPTWTIAAVGVAMPGLRRAAGRLSAGWHGDTADLDAELLLGFVERLHTLDLDEARICGRIVDAGTRAVRRARARLEVNDTIHIDGAWSLPPARPWDHPDWVLARAVAAAVIDADDHLLISATRLDDQPLRTIADQLGITVATAATWRRRGRTPPRRRHRQRRASGSAPVARRAPGVGWRMSRTAGRPGDGRRDGTGSRRRVPHRGWLASVDGWPVRPRRPWLSRRRRPVLSIDGRPGGAATTGRLSAARSQRP